MGDQKIQTQWTLGEALWEFTPKELQSRCKVARKAWEDAGSPTRFVRFSPSVRGSEAAGRNLAQQQARRLYQAQKASSWQLWEALRDELVSGRLKAMGSPASANANPIAIRAAAWRNAKVLSWRLSTIAIDGSPATKFFDVRITAAPIRLTEKKEAAKICDETAFKRLLVIDMRRSPLQRLKPKNQYFGDAQKMGLGKKAFNRTWDDAIAVADAVNWRVPGPIPKHLNSNQKVVARRDHHPKRS